MIGKLVISITIAASAVLVCERAIRSDMPSPHKDGEKNMELVNMGFVDREFNSITDLAYSLDGKRVVIGQNRESFFFSLHEKDPRHPEKMITKYVRANKRRANSHMLEYVECNPDSLQEELSKENLFLLPSEEIVARLTQNGSTY